MNRIIIGIIIGMVVCLPQAKAQQYTLSDCINMALDNNAKIKNSKLDIQIADQMKKEAFTNFFPQISAGGTLFSANRGLLQKNIDLSPIGGILGQMGMDPAALGIPPSLPVELLKNGKMAHVTAIQPVFVGGQIVNGNKLAEIGREVSLLQFALSENDVRLKTEKYFRQIVSLQEKMKTVEESESQLASIYKDVKGAVDAGIAVPNDLLRVELEQQKVASKRLTVENGLRVSKLLLGQQMGFGITNFDIVPEDFANIESPLRHYISQEEGVERRPESRLLDKSVEAAKLEKRIAIGKQMPSIGVGASYMYHDLLDQNTDGGVVFAKISIPLSGWWGGSHAIKRERLKEQKAINIRKENKELMAVEIEAKWSALQEAYSQILLMKKSIESSVENLSLNRDYYNAGTVSLSDLLEAQTFVQQNRDGYTEACAAYYDSLTEYLQATGR